MDARLTMAPPPPRRINWTAARVTIAVPMTLTSRLRCQSSGVASMPLRTKVAALLTRMSRRPNVISAAVASEAASAGLAMSAWTNTALPPAATMRSRTSAPPRSSMSPMTTEAPCSASNSAVAAPMPSAAPVTRATLLGEAHGDRSLRSQSRRREGTKARRTRSDAITPQSRRESGRALRDRRSAPGSRLHASGARRSRSTLPCSP